MMIAVFLVLVGLMGALMTPGLPAFVKRRTGWNPELVDWNYRIVVFLLLSATLSILIAIVAGNPVPKQTTLSEAVRWLAFIQPGRDSWTPMTQAILHYRAHPDVPIYSQIFFADHVKLQYPPSSFLFLDIPQRLSGVPWGNLYGALDLLSWLTLPAIGISCCALFLQNFNHSRTEFPAVFRLILGATFIALAASFYPIAKAHQAGQIQMYITLMVAIGLLAWNGGGKFLCGVLLGICCAIKPQWVVIFLWACLRREWRMALGFGTTFGILMFASVLLYGIGNWIDYIPVLSFISAHGEAFNPNQSANGLVNRLLFNGGNLYFDMRGFAPYNPIVYAATMVSGIALLGGALLYRVNRRPDLMDLMLVILSLTIASPVAWEHHYGVLLPMFAVLAPTVIARQTLGKWTPLYVGIAFLLASQRYDLITNKLADTAFNILQSYLFIGAVMILILLYWRFGRRPEFSPAAIDAGRPSPA